ncbi:type II secretion system F family protein [Candidatus Micrarchaeota archaeon]|nr:type II secretion system F family protein [Candidatus Micrarchaeota archaeon]
MKSFVEKYAPKFGNLPFYRWFSEKTLSKLEEDIIMADFDVTPEELINFAFAMGLILGLYFALMYYIVTSNIPMTFAVFLISFAFMFMLIKMSAYFERKKRAEIMEADLPLALRAIGVQLDIKMPFEKALEHIAESKYNISYEFKRAVKEIKGGASIPKALTDLTNRIDSPILKRAVNQLIITYERGGRGDDIKRIANELIDIQFAKVKEFESQMAMMGLIFIAVSSLIPAFFTIFAVVGGLMMPIDITPVHIWLAYLLLFPMLDGIVIYVIKSRTPYSTNIRITDLNKEIALIEDMLDRKGIRYTFRQIMIAVTGVSIAAGLVSVLLAYYMFPQLLIYSFFPFVFPVLVFFYLTYLVDQRTAKMEQMLPDALFQAASLQKGMSTERIIKEISKHDYGPLSEEFALASRQITAGTSVEDALSDIAERNNSLLLERAVNLLIYGYQVGGNMYHALRETAEDMFSLFALIRERKAALALQKYTMLLGGAVLVPMILGIVLQVTGGLDISSISTYFGKNVDPSMILETSQKAIQFYLVIYAAITGYLIASQEGETRKALIYFLFMSITALILFNISMNLKFM